MDKDQIATAISTTQSYAYITTNYILNSFSILFSFLLIFSITTLKVKEINYSNRVSLLFVMYISITQVLFSISQIFRIDTNNFTMWTSYLSSWGYVFSTLLICSLVMSMLINLQLIFIYNYKKITNLKNYYIVTSFSFSMLLSALPISFGKFNYDQGRKHFWYDTVIWEWATYTGWITFSILYCLISMIYMFYYLNKKPQKISLVMPYNSSLNTVDTINTTSSTTLTNNNTISTLIEDPIQSKLIFKYISRITLYSLIPILSYSPTIISNLSHYYNNYTDKNFFTLNLISLIFISLQSIITFIVFLFDPIIDEVIFERKRYIDHKQQVLDNVKKGIYVENIYKIELELPSNNDQNDQNDQSDNNNKNNRKRSYPRSRSRSTIYSYAMNAKNRISSLTAVIYNKKRDVDVNNVAREDVFNLDNEEVDLLILL